MLTSMKRASSRWLALPQPSTMLNTIDSAERVVCACRDADPLRGKDLQA
jgi:hypothetical protein